MKQSKTKTLVTIAILVALLCVGSQIAIPTPFLIPITLQALFVSLIGFMLKPKGALISIFAYIVIGAVGIPVFANLGAGIGTLFSYTGGFIFGFLPLVLLCSIGNGKIKILFGIIGLLLCHTIGIIWYSAISQIDIFTSFLTMSLPYLFKDIALVVIAYFLSRLINKKIKKQG